ncbi:MAG: fluoride efflux transporter CrcB [Sutterellaceae bacterium]|nr:fluoride efflux transporter CrcB [Sutterellaceae bacterium]MDD7443050.1 fluoride efflux transporter CrcB [Sutterellaceae bacterium]MDY2867943.1 fluoride efflux transporter CrcB [Mesosutterella sp.]
MTRDGPIVLVLLSVGLGAAIGASLRWGLSYLLNSRWDAMPLGTLACNLSGAFAIGCAVAALIQHPEVPPLARLFLVTGLLGGLTTFSTFSSESVAMLMNGLWMKAFLHASAHLFGSLACTAAGFWCVNRLL